MTAPTPGWANTRDNGFDTVRLLAAVAVLVSHAFALTGFREPLEGASRGMTLGILAVGVFFVTSGLLITMSAERRDSLTFTKQRARRLMPGLVVCVIVCIAVGALLTSLPLAKYFSHPSTWRFAGNVIFLPNLSQLPGVFEARLSSSFNGSLWTLRYEVACYTVSLGYARWQWGGKRALLWLAWLGSLTLSRLLTGDEGGTLYHVERLAYLFRFYGAGMLLYAYRDRVSLRGHLAFAAFALVCISPLVGLFAEAAATLGAYALIVAAYRAPHWFRSLTKRGDISYGVYLYAYPIQQLLVPISAETSLPWLTNIFLALPLTFLAGIASWYFVERLFMAAHQKPLHQASARAF